MSLCEENKTQQMTHLLKEICFEASLSLGARGPQKLSPDHEETNGIDKVLLHDGGSFLRLKLRVSLSNRFSSLLSVVPNKNDTADIDKPQTGNFCAIFIIMIG